MLALLASPLARLAGLALAILLVVAGVLYLEHRGAARQAALDQVAAMRASAAQAAEAGREQAAAAGAAARQEAAAGAATAADRRAAETLNSIAATATKDAADAPDAAAPVPADLQRLLDRLRQPAEPAATGRH